MLASVHTIPEQFENGRKFDSNKLVTISQEFGKLFSSIKGSHNVFFKMCMLQFRFQNILLSKSASKDMPFSCAGPRREFMGPGSECSMGPLSNEF